MATVASILKEKGNLVFSVSPETTIFDCLKLMAEKKIGSVLVMQDDNVVGIFSERDYARRGILQGNDEHTAVKKIMTDRVYYVSPDQSVQACMAQMSDKRIRHLPVVQNNKVVGVISIGDVVKSMLEDKETLIKGLENYILQGVIKL
ncbi:MAG: CBS domain-containing protein [Anaerolineaceae bacterium]|jgi:CBS domain-containing protein